MFSKYVPWHGAERFLRSAFDVQKGKDAKRQLTCHQTVSGAITHSPTQPHEPATAVGRLAGVWSMPRGLCVPLLEQTLLPGVGEQGQIRTQCGIQLLCPSLCPMGPPGMSAVGMKEIHGICQISRYPPPWLAGKHCRYCS